MKIFQLVMASLFLLVVPAQAIDTPILPEQCSYATTHDILCKMKVSIDPNSKPISAFVNENKYDFSCFADFECKYEAPTGEAHFFEPACLKAEAGAFCQKWALPHLLGDCSSTKIFTLPKSDYADRSAATKACNDKTYGAAEDTVVRKVAQIPGEVLSCSGKCETSLVPNPGTCDSKVIFSETVALCSLKLYGRSAKRLGNRKLDPFYFPTRPKDSFAQCVYNRPCSEFAFLNEPGKQPDTKNPGKYCKVPELVGEPAFNQPDSYCNQLTDSIKANNDLGRVRDVLKTYWFEKAGMPWKDFVVKAQEDCNEINEDAQEEPSYEQCRKAISKVYSDFVNTKTLPYYTRMCCQIPSSDTTITDY